MSLKKETPCKLFHYLIFIKNFLVSFAHTQYTIKVFIDLAFRQFCIGDKELLATD